MQRSGGLPPGIRMHMDHFMEGEGGGMGFGMSMGGMGNGGYRGMPGKYSRLCRALSVGL
jgi:hypothetical protein